MIKVIDLFIALIGLLLIWPLFIVIIVIGFIDTGSPFFVQTRVGRNKVPFKLVKFRTMNVNTISVASHLSSSSNITKIGAFLRKTKLDELPQLINVLKGEMSLVGPRPNLFNQEELIVQRDARGVYDVTPGITGLAQLNNVDMSTPEKLAKLDQDMISSLSLKLYIGYLLKTLIGSGKGDAIK